MRQLKVPILFFLAALFLDNLVTAQGTAGFQDVSREGNPVVVWLWELLGEWRWTAPFLWAALVLLVGFLLHQAKPFLGLWWLYGVGAGHLIGFLSWTPLNVLSLFAPVFTGPVLLALLVGVSAVLGLALSALHSCLRS